MGDPKNSFFHLKLIEKMSFNLNFRALKGSVPKTLKFLELPLYVVKNNTMIQNRKSWSC
jgi:hypothetical protein